MKRLARRLSGGWMAAGLVVVLTLPTLVWLREPPWHGDPSQTFQVFGAGAAFILAAILVGGGVWRGSRRAGWPSREPGRTPRAVVAPVLATGVAYGALLLLFSWGASEPAEGLFAVAATVCAAWLGLGRMLPSWLRGVAVAGVVVLLGVALIASRPATEKAAPAVEYTTRATGHHRLRIAYHNRLVPDEARRGGGLARIGESYVRMTGGGTFHRIRESDDGEYEAEPLPWPSPLNLAAFEAAGVAQPFAFRALDLIGLAADGRIRVFATHHYWHPGEGCFGVRLSELVVDGGLRPAASDWRRLYETTPCLMPDPEGSRRPAGIRVESGGRMAWLGPGRLLLTVGDHGFDGWNVAHAAPQSEDWDYGRTLLIDVRSGAVETFAIGQRNPQGLHVTPEGRIWSTEHGPQGGDELNVLVQGANYGWPYQTVGTDYGRRVWPVLDDSRGPFVDPVLAWVPSIGVSQLVEAPAAFSRWAGDLLVGSLRAETLFHLGMEGDRVVYSEPIHIGRRIRDVIHGREGAIWLWTDGGDLVVVALHDEADRGEEVFSACAPCHQTGRADRSGSLGPPLRGVMGRPIASRGDFDYSLALRGVEGVWTPERLDRFLADPQAFAPGTTMTLQQTPDAEDRAALIAYLRELR